LCVDNKLEVAIIDSVTHLWSGEGGLLEQQGDVAKRTKNSYTAWREITPMYNTFLEKMLQSPLHIITTMRAKTEHVQEKDANTGKSVVTKLGLEPEIRKGFEFELTTFLEINAEHEAFGSKDRTSLYDQKTFKITPKVGMAFMKWLQGGVTTEHVVVATAHTANPAEAFKKTKDDIITRCKVLGGLGNTDLMTTLKRYTPTGNPNSVSDDKLVELKAELDSLQVPAPADNAE
jgi:hypothetical protein